MFMILADNKMKAGDSGAIDAIVNTVNTHIDNVDICKCGCGIFMTITTIGKFYSMLNRFN